MAAMRHIIAITLQNESGALTRVAGLFSTRGYNIESLNVAATDDPTVSRLTLVTTGNDAVIHQITQQSLKLVDVVDVEDVTREEHFERELLLIKVKAKATQSKIDGFETHVVPGITAALGAMLLVQLPHQVELPALHLRRERAIAEERDHLLRVEL